MALSATHRLASEFKTSEYDHCLVTHAKQSVFARENSFTLKRVGAVE